MPRRAATELAPDNIFDQRFSKYQSQLQPSDETLKKRADYFLVDNHLFEIITDFRLQFEWEKSGCVEQPHN